jgi:tetratricopeptide (TPR) repeat protein
MRNERATARTSAYGGRARRAAGVAATLAALFLAGGGAARAQAEKKSPEPKAPEQRGKAAPIPLDNRPEQPNSRPTAKPLTRTQPRPGAGAVASGDAALRGGDLRGAARNYAQAVLANPREPMLRLAAGVALAENGMVSQAVEQFRVAVRYAEDDVISALLLQSALSQTGAGSEAQEIYQDTYRRYSRADKPGLDVSRSVARLNAAIGDYGPSPVFYLLLGDACQLGQDFPGADRAYAKAHDLAPRWAKPVVNLGLSRLAQGKSDLAIATFQAALKLDPANKQARVWETTVRGQQFANNRQYPRAIATLNSAQRLAPKDPTPTVIIAQIEADNGNLMGAADAYETALRITRDGGLFAQRPMLYRYLAETWLTAKKPEKAREVLLDALRDEPASAPLWYRFLARAHFDLGQAEQGEEMLKAALDSEPGPYPADTLNALDGPKGLLDRLKARYNDELKAAAAGFSTTVQPDSVKITAVTPENRAVSQPIRPLLALAHIARYQRDFREEISLRRRLTELRNNPWDWYLMAETYDQRLFDPANAREAYLRALEIHNEKSGLNEATVQYARERLKALTGPAYKPE